jgi:hypothetical protein
MSDLAISKTEQNYLVKKDLENFWYSRLQKKDPIARIGYALWCKKADDLKRAIAEGESSFWDNKGYVYWELMARSTVVNLAAGLEKSGYHGTFSQTRAKIKEIGVEVARQHAISVQRDIKNNIGNTPGLLSLRQIAKYHHLAFTKFGIPPDYYGGTWFGVIPDKLEYKIYGGLYCHDCDTSDAPQGSAH